MADREGTDRARTDNVDRVSPSPTIVVEKLKWDGSVSARWRACLLDVGPGRLGWLTPAGTRRERPRRGMVDETGRDTIAAGADGWWVVTASLDEDGEPRYLIDASTPPRLEEGVLRFVDLDLDLDVEGDAVELRDVPQFMERVRNMHYPLEARRGAWDGLADASRRYWVRGWPFDGSLAARLRARPAAAAGPRRAAARTWQM
jgi:Protein of unknown function (DUF402)